MLESYWKDYLEKMIEADPMYLGVSAVVGLILCSIIFTILNRGLKKSSAKKIAPKIKIKQIQVAPLGKGVQVKLENVGEIARVTDVQVKRRKDIKITQAFKDFIFEKNKIYSILFEAEGKGRIDDGFDLNIEYNDSRGNAYRQSIHVEKVGEAVNKPKLVKLV